MKRVLALVVVFLISLPCLAAPKTERVSSPNGKVTVKVTMDEGIRYSVLYWGRSLLMDMPVSMTLGDGTVLGKNPELIRTNQHEIKRILKPEVRVKNAAIEDHCNEMRLSFKGKYVLVFRVYDDAVAYRWATYFDTVNTIVKSEEVVYQFNSNCQVLFPEEASYLTHSERLYIPLKLNEIKANQFCSLPVLVDVPRGPKVLITEADLQDYPGLYLQGSSGLSLTGRIPAVCTSEEQKSDRTVAVTQRADYIAETEGNRSYPWRVAIIAAKDKDLLNNETIYKLSSPCELKDTSWIKPGKVAWDWWNFNNVFGVDFRAGVNTETYKYYIDFAAKHGIEYIVLDEGWYKLGDLLDISPDMDIEALFAYAKEKKVGIILWVVWKTLDDQLQEALDQFAQWGAVGIKVDFMQRDDQWMVQYYERIAKEAAKRHMLVDFHGSYSPKGLRRRFPNVITREGVKGLENCKWSEDITPEHDVTLPFTRMVAGPMDFTPGAMLNGQGKNFSVRFNRPMSQGTRCHQLAMYVIYESPLQMLADSPSHYYREPECMEFLGAVPTVWDETIALDGKVGDYVVMARRSGQDWYLGAMTDEHARELTIDLDFLGKGTYQAKIYQDGPNADRYGNDFTQKQQKVKASDTIKIKLATGGGWVAQITK